MIAVTSTTSIAVITAIAVIAAISQWDPRPLKGGGFVFSAWKFHRVGEGTGPAFGDLSVLFVVLGGPMGRYP